MSNIILYTSEDGTTRLDLRVEAQTVWLTQLEIAELFQTTKQNVSLHAGNILKEGELLADSVVKDSLTTAADSKQYRTKLYNLDLILAIGYRVRSPRGVQFRQWATSHLKEYLLKGFVMDDERLKNPDGWDYFDELLERIRDIRASEKRFYQKVRDLFALSSDYHQHEQETNRFFAQAQNMLLYAATGHTAAELVVERADASQPNMALEFWQNNLNHMLAFNDQPVLDGAGAVSHQDMKQVVQTRYNDFDQKRRQHEAIEADIADLNSLEALEQQLKDKKP